MTIFAREWKGQWKSLAIWTGVIGGLMALCVALYPSMASSMDEVSEMFAQMGSFSAAFGMDKLSFGTIMGFYGVECGNIIGVGGAFFAAVTAMGLLAGEEGGHTAEFLLTHPVSRVRVVLEKLAALVALILVLNAVCLLCGGGTILMIGEEPDWGDLLTYHGALLLMQLEIGGLAFGISAFLRRSSFGLAIGVAALMYFLGIVINLDAGLDWLRFVTPYYYADAARLFSGETVTGPALAGCLWAVLAVGVGLWQYRRKDISA